MFSTKSNAQALNKGYSLSSLMAIGPDWQEEEQQHQLQLLSEDAMSGWIRVGDKAIIDFLIELESLPEAVPAAAGNSKEETSNTGNQLSGSAVADWSKVGGNDETISNFLAELVNTPDAIPASYGDTWKEAGNAGEQSVPTATHLFECPATEYTCNIGNQMFRNDSSLQQYRLTHGNEYPYGNVSDNVSETATGFEDDDKHYHKHQPPLKCSFCDLTYAFPSRLAAHQVVHFDQRLFECPLCHCTFKREASLKWHQKSHNDDRPYRCGVCGSRFKKNCYLKKHEALHNSNYMYKCATCGRICSNSYDLERHQVVHNKKKNFTCQFCQKKYGWNQSLLKHLRQKHHVIAR